MSAIVSVSFSIPHSMPSTIKFIHENKYKNSSGRRKTQNN